MLSCVVLDATLVVCRLAHIEFGPQWRSMSKGEKATYFKMAEELRQIHKLNNPSWSHQVNYVSKHHTVHSSLHW